MVAAQYQEGDAAINLLLDRGAQVAPPADGAPVFSANPFVLASYAGNAKSLKRLLAAGGKVDEAFIAIGTSRTTPMLGAFKFGDVEVANTLLDLGAPVDFADGNGITMLGRTVLNNEVEMARMLIARGANVNVVDKLGMTPLLWAANVDFGDTAMIELLLKSGAKTDARNKDGLTPLELARKHGHTTLIPVLEKASTDAVERRLQPPRTAARARSVRSTMPSSAPIEVVGEPPLEGGVVDRVDGAGARQVERVRGGRAHRDARTHDADGRQRAHVRIHAPPRGDDVVGVPGHHARERDVVDVVRPGTSPSAPGPARCAAPPTTHSAPPHRRAAHLSESRRASAACGRRSSASAAGRDCRRRAPARCGRCRETRCAGTG